MNLEVKPIPIPKDAEHPAPPDERLPYHEFTMALVAPKGSGKTTVIANLLRFYKGFFHTIIVFSPTVASDEKWDWVKQQKLLVENKPLKKWILDQSRHRKEDQIVQSAPIGHELEGLVNMREQHDGLIPEKFFIDSYDQETLSSIMAEQMKICKLLKKHGKTKHLANRILLIFDDLVGSTLFSNAKDNPFKMLNANHRHHSMSLLMVTQAYKEIPKTVRNNYSCLILFETPNAKEIEAIYEDFPMNLNKEQWYEMYEHATSGDHDFLYLNHQKKKGFRCMRNFQHVLLFQ